MFLSLLPVATSAVFLVVYFFLARPHPLCDFSVFHPIPVVVYAAFTVLHMLAFSIQDTTRQLVRIYLLQKFGIGYDERLISRYQVNLTPNWAVPLTPFYLGANIASFPLLLFNYGWGVAIIAHVLAHVILIWIPIPYWALMPSIRKQLDRKSKMEKFEELVDDFDAERFKALIDESLKEEKNLADWWTKLMWEKTAEVTEKQR